MLLRLHVSSIPTHIPTFEILRGHREEAFRRRIIRCIKAEKVKMLNGRVTLDSIQTTSPLIHNPS
jgi:hypothetical protein